MKKLFAVIALVGIMSSCKDKKNEEPKADDATTTAPATEATTTEPSTTAVAGVPTFSDPEVQKFANDYNAFILEYKAGMKDPARIMELSKNMQDWATRAQSIGMKLAAKPEEAKAWAEWAASLSQNLMPAGQ